jgi:hypothetical protein
MRYVSSTFQASTLDRGKELEQFMGGRLDGADRTIRWIELRPTACGVEVWDIEVPDLGGIDFTDVYEFGSDDIQSPVATFASPREALDYAHSQLAASPNRWVNVTVVGDEYRDYVLAGRPSQWPAAGT